MKKIIPLIFIVFFITYCTSNKSIYTSEKEWNEYLKVNRCRGNWKYGSFEGELELKIIRHELKGRHDLTSWPNFFIGTINSGDTVGVIEYDVEKEIMKGEIIKLLPTKRKYAPTDEIQYFDSDEPLLSISPKPKDNDLYCAIKIIYYGKLISKPSRTNP